VHGILAKVDPVSAQRIHPNNVKRVVRALEIYEQTGSKPSDIFDADSRRESRYPDTRFFGLTMDRKKLYARIEKRVDMMIEAGLVEEVSQLMEMGVRPNTAAMQGLGYKEIAGYLGREHGLDEAVELLKKNTRRFAKRQYTWFRADPRVQWIDVDGRTASEVSIIIKESLDK
jgi:tRNA dimethylallyltransferase